MKKVAVFGAKGKMGKLYSIILEQFTDCDVVKIDIDSSFGIDFLTCDGFIIATPTDTHAKIIAELVGYDKPILCETPVTTNIMELQTLLSYKFLDISMIDRDNFNCFDCWSIDFSDIDKGYIQNIQDWVKGWRNKEDILPTHLMIVGEINAEKK
jgi:hypothetical protein